MAGSASKSDCRRRLRGLVLAGGGAKGAYQYGCLLALKSHGIKFDVVSGTSVGSLNAFLWSSDQLEAGRNIWEEISLAKIYPWRIPFIFRLPASLVVVILHALSAFLRGIPLPLWPTLIASAIAYSPFLFLNIFVPLFFIFVAISRWYFSPIIYGGNLVFLAVIFLIEIISAVAELVIGPIQRPFGDLSIGASVGGLTYTAAIALLCGWATNNPLHLLQSGPLRATVTSLCGRDLHTPTYVCAAIATFFFDPDNPRYVRPQTSPQKPVPHPGEEIIVERREMWMARYFLLNEMTSAERCEALLASAALPFGIVESVQIGGETFVDGGVVDNIPIYPAVSLMQCDEIVVVGLSNTSSGDDAYKASWQKIDRSIRVRRFSQTYPDAFPWNYQPEFRERNRPPKVIPFEQPAHWPARILTISPARSLGGFFRGTLNFSPAYTKRLIEQGYQDAAAMIATITATETNIEGTVAL